MGRDAGRQNPPDGWGTIVFRSEEPTASCGLPAEAVAYVVCQSISLDTNTAFSDYIQLYKGDRETLISSIQRIKDVSKGIISELIQNHA